MSFGRELVKALQGKKRDQENPLEIIGLSPAILELGLSRDELYEHCRRIARDLLARVHPDKHGGVATPAVAKYSEAFNLLDNRKVFDEALTEFREVHSYERREKITLRQQIANLQGEFKFQSEQLKKETAARKEDMKIRQWMCWYLASKSMRFSSDKIKPLTHREQFAVISLEFKFSSPPSKERLEKFKEIYGANPSQEEVGQLTRIFNENRLGAKKLSLLIARALDSGFKTPAIRWSFELGARELGFRELAPYLSHIERGGIIRDALMPKWSSAKIQKYKQILVNLSLKFRDRYVVEASIAPVNVMLEDQFLRDPLDKKDLYVIGTVEPDIGFAQIREERFGQTEKDPSRLTMEKNILFHIDPFLSAERAVICIRPPMKRFSLNANNLKAQWNNLHEKKGGMEQMPTFCLSHIIVDV